MARKQAKSIKDGDLTKGELRSLNALRQRYGQDLADEFFSKVLEEKGSQTHFARDKNAEAIADALQKLREQKNLQIPRGGYVVKSGRGRVIVSPAAAE